MTRKPPCKVGGLHNPNIHLKPEEKEPIRLGNRGYHLARFFDGHGSYAAQSGIFARQFLVAESAVNLL
jgi:hypothetical protein